MSEKQTSGFRRKPEPKTRVLTGPVSAGNWASVRFATVLTKLSQRRADVLHMADGSRWKIAPVDLAVIDGWRESDPIEGSGFWKDATVTNLRRTQTVSATRLAPGEE